MTKMKTSFVFDLIGVAGFSSSVAGVYLIWGLPVALIAGGLSSLVLVIAKQWGK